MVPSRPWRPVSGLLEAVVAHDGDAPARQPHGTAIDVDLPVLARGWIVDDRTRKRPADPITTAWLLVDDEPAFVLSKEERPDVADIFGSRSTGYAGSGIVAASGGERTFGILARAEDGSGLVLRTSLTRNVAIAPLESPPSFLDRSLDDDSTLVIRSEPALRESPRRRHEIPIGGALHVRGQVIGSARAYVRVRSDRVDRWYGVPLSRPGAGSDGIPVADAGYDMLLRARDLPAGGYTASLYAGEPARPRRTARFAISPEDAFPLGLRPFAHAPPCEFAPLRTAAVVSYGGDAPADAFLAGEPIWLEGSIEGRVIAAFATVRGLRPFSIAHAETASGSTRFAGVVQTTELRAGPHRVEVRLVPPTGNGYYVAGPRTFTLRLPSPLAGPSSDH